jgi:hypothetical protein
MEPVIVYLLSVQLWTEPPPKIQLVYTKEYATHEECMRERAKWDEKKLVALCLMKVKKNG